MKEMMTTLKYYSEIESMHFTLSHFRIWRANKKKWDGNTLLVSWKGGGLPDEMKYYRDPYEFLISQKLWKFAGFFFANDVT